MSTPPTVLVVCTGNICRSPAFERLLADRLPGVVVRSAGTGGLVGEPIDPQMAAQLAAAGVDPGGFAATRLTAEALRGADVVLAMGRDHLAAAARLAPAVARRSYLVDEFAWLLERVEAPGDDPAERLAAALPAVAASRSRLIVEAGATFEEIADPYRRSDRVFADVFGRLAGIADRIGARLAVG